MKTTKILVAALAFATGIMWIGSSFVSVSAATGTLTMTSNKSAWIDQHAPEVHYDAPSAIITGWGNTYGDDARRGLLSFTLEALPEGATVTSVTLRLHTDWCVGLPDASLSVFQITSSWSDADVTWNSAPSVLPVGSPQVPPSCSVDSWVELSMDTIYNNWVGGQSNYGILLRGVEFGDEWQRQFSSSNAVSTSSRPQLVVNYTYTPAPDPISETPAPDDDAAPVSEEASVGDTAPAADLSSTASTSTATDSGAAPTTTTDSSIKAPTELVITDVPKDQGGSLQLDWKKSMTDDIDGYTVFRSGEAKNNFKEIAKTGKTVLTYNDTQAALNQNYYYMARAYKGTKESASTATLSGVSIDNIAPAIPQSFKFAKNASGSINLSWDKNSEADLADYVLSITDPSDDSLVLETVEIAKDLTVFELDYASYPKLDPNVDHTFYLTAKDASGNISEKAKAADGAVTAVAAAAKDASIWSKFNNEYRWYTIFSLAVIALGLGGLLYYLIRKRKLPKITAKLPQ